MKKRIPRIEYDEVSCSRCIITGYTEEENGRIYEKTFPSSIDKQALLTIIESLQNEVEELKNEIEHIKKSS